MQDSVLSVSDLYLKSEVYTCLWRPAPRAGFHDRHMVGFFLRVPSPLEDHGERERERERKGGREREREGEEGRERERGRGREGERERGREGVMVEQSTTSVCNIRQYLHGTSQSTRS